MLSAYPVRPLKPTPLPSRWPLSGRISRTLASSRPHRTDLFDYRYSKAEDGSASAYFIKFCESLFGAGIVLSKSDPDAEVAAEARGD